MACCAFALFVVSQLLWPLARLRRFLPFANRVAAMPPVDQAASWRIGMPPPADRPPANSVRPHLRRALVLGIAVELVLTAGIASAAYSKITSGPESAAIEAADGTEPFLDAWHAPICRALGLDES